MMSKLKGVYPVLLTPLDEDRKIDVQSLKNLVDHIFETGCNGLIILGEISESRRLTEEERNLVADTVFDQTANRGPVIVGATRQGTEAAVDTCLWAQKKGAGGVMVSPPTLSKPSDESVLNHYKAIGDAIKIPIVVQDHPESSSVLMSPALLARISREVKGAEYLKLEDPPTPWKLSRVRSLSGDKMSIFGGENGAWMIWELDRGSSGVMTAFGYPEVLVEVVDAHLSGNRERAWGVFTSFLPVFHYYSQRGVGLSVGKEIYVRKGIFKTAKVKQPGAELDELAKRELADVIRRAEEKLKVTAR